MRWRTRAGRPRGAGTVVNWSTCSTGSGRRAAPPPQTVRAIDRLAELPSQIKEILAAGLDARSSSGPAACPTSTRWPGCAASRCPPGAPTWDACAGAYG